MDATRPVNGVSCTNSSSCVAVGGSGDEVNYNGTTWGSANPIDLTRGINAVSCATLNSCVAVGASGYVVVESGGTWGSPLDKDSTRTMYGVSCPSTTFCEAVGSSGYGVAYNSGTWGSPASLNDGTRTLNAVSCTSNTFCVAVGSSGWDSMWDGSTWTANQIDGTHNLNGVSCVSTTFCMAVDANGNELTYNGSMWSTTPVNIDGSTSINAVSCVSTSYCVAVDQTGKALTYANGSWSTTSIDGGEALNAVSCSSTNFCEAVDGSGSAIEYGTGPITANAQLTWNTGSELSAVLSDGANDYVYGPTNTPVEEVSLSSSVPTFMTYSATNGTWLLTNAAGDETAFYGYDAFGNLAFGTSGSAFGYAGQYTDAVTGLSNMRARWYEPQTGEFTSVDPALSSTNQAYVYAGDDSVNETDPTGLWIEDALIDKTFTPDGAQNFVESLVAPFIRQMAFETEVGNRVVDAYGVSKEWMNEVKTGSVNNTASNDLQSTKDGLLKAAGYGIVKYVEGYGSSVKGLKFTIRGGTWWVLPNLAEQSSMSQPQKNALTFDGINAIIFHYVPPGDLAPVSTSQLANAAQSDNAANVHATLRSVLITGGCSEPGLELV
jgi:RHS repeat-associated protein